MSSLDTYSNYVTISYIIIYGSIFLSVAIYSAYEVYITHARVPAQGRKTTSPDPQPHNEDTSFKATLEDEKESKQNGQTDTIVIDCDDAKDMHNDDPQPHNEATSLKTPPEDEKESKQNGQTDTIVIDCDDAKDTNNDNSKQKCCGIGCVNFLKVFGKSIATKKSVYLSLIPHLFDQGTDFGVIWQYYALSKTDVSQNINYAAFFYCSIAVIIIHKLITCSVVWTLTESVRDVVLQVFDLMMVKAIYASYKSQTNEPGNAQKLLQILEGTFESGPQIFISLVFLIKSETFDSVVFVSLLFSFWSLAGRVIAEDKGSVAKLWKEPEWNFKHRRFVNPLYVLRVLYRYAEIMSRITLYALLWVSLGGVALGVILGLELFVIIMVSMRSGEMMLVANLLYFFRFQIGYFVYGLFVLYKFVWAPVFYMLLITASVYNKNNTNRHDIVIDAPLGLVSFVYCWVTSILLSAFLCCSSAIDLRDATAHPLCYRGPDLTKTSKSRGNDTCYASCYLTWQHVFTRVSLSSICNYMQSDAGEMTRDPKSLLRQGKYHDVLNLMAFGMPKKKLLFQDDEGTIFHLLFDRCQDMVMFSMWCDIVFELDPNLWNVKNQKGRLCTFACKNWKMIRYLVDTYDVDERELISHLQHDGVNAILRDEDLNNLHELIHMSGPTGTILHHLFENENTSFDTFKEVAEQIQGTELWTKPDQFGCLCGDVGYDGEQVLKYLTYLVDEYEMDPKDFFSNTYFDPENLFLSTRVLPGNLHVQYGPSAKDIMAFCDITYEELSLVKLIEKRLTSSSEYIKKYFKLNMNFFKEQDELDDEQGMLVCRETTFAGKRKYLKNTAFEMLTKQSQLTHDEKTWIKTIVKSTAEADATWLRHIGDSTGLTLRQTMQRDPANFEHNLNMEWLDSKLMDRRLGQQKLAK
eukprot:911769_1